MLTTLRGYSNTNERAAIPILDSNPQELMTFVDQVFHKIFSPLYLPFEPKDSKFHPQSKEISLDFTSSPSPIISCRRSILGCSESITLFRDGLLRGTTNPL
jgi:hypothetical protein